VPLTSFLWLKYFPRRLWQYQVKAGAQVLLPTVEVGRALNIVSRAQVLPLTVNVGQALNIWLWQETTVTEASCRLWLWRTCIALFMTLAPSLPTTSCPTIPGPGMRWHEA